MNSKSSRSPYFSWSLVFILGGCIWSPSSKCATHWRLGEDGEVNAIYNEMEDVWEKDPLFHILATSSSNFEKPSKDGENSSSDMIFLPNELNMQGYEDDDEESNKSDESANSKALMLNVPAFDKFTSATLTCGDPVNKSLIDHLEGVARRFKHPVYKEPEVALLFQNNDLVSLTENLKLETIEKNLLDAIKSQENTMVLFNQIANFLRINGDTYHAIECFRKVLSVSNHDADALLNLARILYNLRFTNNAIYLAKQSLDNQPPDQTTWIQHYTLGEFLERNGEFERALTHFQMALDQNPAFHPAMINIKKLTKSPTVSISKHIYTLCIILLLSSGFIIYLYHNLFKNPKDSNNNHSSSVGPRFKKPSLVKRSKSAM